MAVRGRFTESGIDGARRRCPNAEDTFVRWESGRRALVVCHRVGDDDSMRVVLFPDAVFVTANGESHSVGLATLDTDDMPTLVIGQWINGRWRVDAPNKLWFWLEFDWHYIKSVPPHVFSLAIPGVCDSVAIFLHTAVQWEGTTGHVGVAAVDGSLQLAMATRWPGGGDRYMLCVVEPRVRWELLRVAP